MSFVSRVTRFRTILISDFHLGTRGCKAEFLLDFLRHTESEFLYLVGDIVDGWRLRRSWYWAQSHNDVIQKILRKARKGTKVFYIPGNHDEWLRDYTELQMGGVMLLPEAIHETADGKRLLVMHGDAFDGVVRYAKWLALLGDWAYELTLRLNNVLNRARRRLGLSLLVALGLSQVQGQERGPVRQRLRQSDRRRGRERGVDGIVCGHIHHAEMRQIGGVLYCNDGDWVESCTALVEHFDGTLEIIRWAELHALDPLNPVLRPNPRKLNWRTHENPDRQRRLEAASQRRRPHDGGDVARAREDGTSGDHDHARSVPHAALPVLPGNPPRGGSGQADRRADRRSQARRHPYRDRRADRHRGAALVPQARAALHHRLSHALSGISGGADGGAAAAGLCRCCADFMRRRKA